MNIHEYQAKEILKNFNVKIQEGYVANSPDEAYQNAKKLSDEKETNIFVIKAQIHAGVEEKEKLKKQDPTVSLLQKISTMSKIFPLIS